MRKRLRKMSSPLVVLILLITSICFLNQEVNAWKPKTHVYMANIIMEDARDGKVTIPPFGEFDISPQAQQALRYPNYFRAGSVGPDGFPDMLTGQSHIHTGTDPWLQLMWNQAERERDPEVWAFVLGFLTHCAADMWAHDWVNYYAGGAFPGEEEFKHNPDGSISIVAKHMAIESTLDDQIIVTNNQIDIPHDFVLNTMMLSQKARNAGMPDWIGTLVDLYWDKYPHRNDKVLGVKTYNANWFEDLDKGFNAWITANERAIKRTVEEDESFISSLKEEWQNWALSHYLDMLGVPSLIAASPAIIARALNILPDAIKNLLIELGIVEMLENMRDRFVDWVLEMTIGMDTAEIKRLFNQRVSTTLFGNQYNEIMTTIGNIPGEGDWVHDNNETNFNNFIQSINGPLYNSVILSKLILLPPSQLNKLLGVNCYNNIGNGRNVLLGVLRSIDDSKQWYRGNGLGNFNIYEKNINVFAQIFKPYPPFSNSDSLWCAQDTPPWNNGFPAVIQGEVKSGNNTFLPGSRLYYRAPNDRTGPWNEISLNQDGTYSWSSTIVGANQSISYLLRPVHGQLNFDGPVALTLTSPVNMIKFQNFKAWSQEPEKPVLDLSSKIDKSNEIGIKQDINKPRNMKIKEPQNLKLQSKRPIKSTPDLSTKVDNIDEIKIIYDIKIPQNMKVILATVNNRLSLAYKFPLIIENCKIVNSNFKSYRDLGLLVGVTGNIYVSAEPTSICPDKPVTIPFIIDREGKARFYRNTISLQDAEKAPALIYAHTGSHPGDLVLKVELDLSLNILKKARIANALVTALDELKNPTIPFVSSQQREINRMRKSLEQLLYNIEDPDLTRLTVEKELNNLSKDWAKIKAAFTEAVNDFPLPSGEMFPVKEDSVTVAVQPDIIRSDSSHILPEFKF